MDSLIFFIFIIIIIFVVFTHYNFMDNFIDNFKNITDNKKFMIRDIRTKLWLMDGQENGFSTFLPSRFGTVFLLPENFDEFLPLRILNEPNNYLLSTRDGKNIRVVSNPYNEIFVLQIFIYNGFNIIGYIDNSQNYKYLYIDNNGNITSITTPEDASKIEMIII